MTEADVLEYIRWLMFFEGLLSIVILYFLWRYRRRFGILV